MKKKLQTLTLEQLTTLLQASMDNIDITDLCDSRFSLQQLDLLIYERKNGVNVSTITNPLIPYNNMELLIEAIKSGVNVSELTNPLLDEEKLSILIEASIAGINISGLANPFITLDILKNFIELRASGKDNSFINIIDFNAAEIEETLYLLKNGKSTDRVREIYRDNTLNKLINYIGKKDNDIVKSNIPSRVKIYKIYNQNKNTKKTK